MKPLVPNPHLIEINALTFLSGLRKTCGRSLTLLDIPDDEWGRFRDLGFDVVWLMGVWKRSPAAREAALAFFWKTGRAREVLGDAVEDDITGSPYAVYDYTLDPSLGKPGELQRLKKKLNAMGLRLMLDFVPNHLARDHRWTREHPERFVRGNERVKSRHPEWFFETENGITLAHGRDPYFPPWTDTVQVRFDSHEFRQAMIREMLQIAERCDGVRCDMAMLGLNSVFYRVWKDCLNDTWESGGEFWEELIGEVKRRFPGFLFMAEVYWDLDKELRALGFDYTYDKHLYDLLRDAPVDDIRHHIETIGNEGRNRVLFVENHDEKRAASVFGAERSRAAAAVAATLPGMRFLHGGQLEGFLRHVPVQLRRGPEEEGNPETEAFYEKLLQFAGSEVCKSGEWFLLDAKASHQGAQGYSSVLAWMWKKGAKTNIIVINYGCASMEVSIEIPEELRPVAKPGRSFIDAMTQKKIHVMIEQKTTRILTLLPAPWEVCLLQGESVPPETKLRKRRKAL